MEQQPSRYIEKRVRDALFAVARQRCCLCRELLAAEGLVAPSQRALELHHIVFFSEGGPNTEENLLLVCANCHYSIHADPLAYPQDLLRKVKAHWIGMANLIPSSLLFPSATAADLQVLFLIESLNLSYHITLPQSTSVNDLATFVMRRIVRPLGLYDNNQAWQDANSLKLALRSKPSVYLPDSQSVKDIAVSAEDSFVATVEMRVILQIAPPLIGLPLLAREKPRGVQIHTPRHGDGVGHREVVKGVVGIPHTKVWVLVKPEQSRFFWVQPPTSVFSNGNWTTVAYFGGHSGRWLGVRFAIVALADGCTLEEGQMLADLPVGAYAYHTLQVQRIHSNDSDYLKAGHASNFL